LLLSAFRSTSRNCSICRDGAEHSGLINYLTYSDGHLSYFNIISNHQRTPQLANRQHNFVDPFSRSEAILTLT
jgi:hypothetical protein